MLIPSLVFLCCFLIGIKILRTQLYSKKLSQPSSLPLPPSSHASSSSSSLHSSSLPSSTNTNPKTTTTTTTATTTMPPLSVTTSKLHLNPTSLTSDPRSKSNVSTTMVPSTSFPTSNASFSMPKKPCHSSCTTYTSLSSSTTATTTTTTTTSTKSSAHLTAPMTPVSKPKKNGSQSHTHGTSSSSIPLSNKLSPLDHSPTSSYFHPSSTLSPTLSPTSFPSSPSSHLIAPSPMRATSYFNFLNPLVSCLVCIWHTLIRTGQRVLHPFVQLTRVLVYFVVHTLFYPIFYWMKNTLLALQNPPFIYASVSLSFSTIPPSTPISPSSSSSSISTSFPNIHACASLKQQQQEQEEQQEQDLLSVMKDSFLSTSTHYETKHHFKKDTFTASLPHGLDIVSTNDNENENKKSESIKTTEKNEKEHPCIPSFSKSTSDLVVSPFPIHHKTTPTHVTPNNNPIHSNRHSNKWKTDSLRSISSSLLKKKEKNSVLDTFTTKTIDTPISTSTATTTTTTTFDLISENYTFLNPSMVHSSPSNQTFTRSSLFSSTFTPLPSTKPRDKRRGSVTLPTGTRTPSTSTIPKIQPPSPSLLRSSTTASSSTSNSFSSTPLFHLQENPVSLLPNSKRGSSSAPTTPLTKKVKKKASSKSATASPFTSSSSFSSIPSSSTSSKLHEFTTDLQFNPSNLSLPLATGSEKINVSKSTTQVSSQAGGVPSPPPSPKSLVTTDSHAISSSSSSSSSSASYHPPVKLGKKKTRTQSAFVSCTLGSSSNVSSDPLPPFLTAKLDFDPSSSNSLASCSKTNSTTKAKATSSSSTLSNSNEFTLDCTIASLSDATDVSTTFLSPVSMVTSTASPPSLSNSCTTSENLNSFASPTSTFGSLNSSTSFSTTLSTSNEKELLHDSNSTSSLSSSSTSSTLSKSSALLPTLNAKPFFPSKLPLFNSKPVSPTSFSMPSLIEKESVPNHSPSMHSQSRWKPNRRTSAPSMATSTTTLTASPANTTPTSLSSSSSSSSLDSTVLRPKMKPKTFLLIPSCLIHYSYQPQTNDPSSLDTPVFLTPSITFSSLHHGHAPTCTFVDCRNVLVEASESFMQSYHAFFMSSSNLAPSLGSSSTYATHVPRTRQRSSGYFGTPRSRYASSSFSSACSSSSSPGSPSVPTTTTSSFFDHGMHPSTTSMTFHLAPPEVPATHPLFTPTYGSSSSLTQGTPETTCWTPFSRGFQIDLPRPWSPTTPLSTSPSFSFSSSSSSSSLPSSLDPNPFLHAYSHPCRFASSPQLPTSTSSPSTLALNYPVNSLMPCRSLLPSSPTSSDSNSVSI